MTKDTAPSGYHFIFICYSVYPASKSLMTTRHCSWHADLVSHSSFYISSNISASLRNLIIFTILHSFPIVPLCHSGYCIFFCCPYIEGSLVGNDLFLVFGFHMLYFCKLVVHFLTSDACGLV